MTQLTFDDVGARRFPDIQKHIEEKFLKFHEENPEVYRLFKKFAHQSRRFKDHFGAKAIAERIRWEVASYSIPGDFKMNNNFPSVMARMLIEEDPSFHDFFSIRHTPGAVEIIQ